MSAYQNEIKRLITAHAADVAHAAHAQQGRTWSEEEGRRGYLAECQGRLSRAIAAARSAGLSDDEIARLQMEAGLTA